MTIAHEVARRRTFAIISHPDAGKTTLTEKLLLFAGAMVCGIFVRYYIREAYRSALPAIAADRATDADNEEFRILMIKGTWALVVLWVLLFTIGALGALKPG